MPMVHSSRMTPISARISTSCTALMNPRTWGPDSTPVRINPTIGGIPRRWQTKITAMARGVDDEEIKNDGNFHRQNLEKRVLRLQFQPSWQFLPTYAFGPR
jgi:hypothetical protein